MRFPLTFALLSAALMCSLDSTGHAQAPTPTQTPRTVPNFVTVTDQIMRAPKPEDWLIHRGNYQAWGYSPLDQINKTNVKNLQLVWSRAMEPGINQATPLVYNGVMYLGNPGDVIQAIDAANGDLIWEYRHPQPPATSFRANHGQRKRSIALYGDHVYFVTWDNIVVALEARTGKLAWQTNRGGDLYVSNSSGPIVANGVVVAGSTCQVAGHGCYVTGHDAKTGKELWRNEMIPRPGQPGDETWAGSPFESRWMTGVWGQLTYDPELDLVYYGSSGVGPASEAQRNMPGATMAGTNTRFAVRPKTGEVVWKHQVLPRDNWDQECTFEMMIINTPVNPARRRHAVGQSERASRAAQDADRRPLQDRHRLELRRRHRRVPVGEADRRAEPRRAGSTRRGSSPSTRTPCSRRSARPITSARPINGGRDWPQGAYNPRSNVMYMPLSNLCIDSTARTDRAAAPQFVYNTTNVGKFADRQGQGRPHRRDLGRDRQDAVELGDAGLELLADPGDRRRAPVQRLDGPLPAGARRRQGSDPVADTPSVASRRRCA